MIQQSRIYGGIGSDWCIVIAFALLVFLSATIVVVANPSWADRIVSGVKDMGTSVSQSSAHHVMKAMEKAHLVWEFTSRELKETAKHVRIRP
jgi:hypothetical protein